MIAHIKGLLIEEMLESIVVDVGGLGLEIYCSSNSLADFAGKEHVHVLTYLQVREDALQLFGFSTSLEKKLFLSLIKVNGVGPKMAIQMLGGASIDDIVGWIDTGDTRSLTRLPKVGKRTAEQLILTLRGRLVEPDQNGVKLPSRQTIRSEVTSALLNLGFKNSDIDQIINEIPEDSSLETGVRKGLHLLSQ